MQAPLRNESGPTSATHEAHANLRRVWAEGWAHPDYDPDWTSTELPSDVRAALNWFAPAARLLDIGCGDGRLSALLAAEGFRVFGIDFAAGAIERARNQKKLNETNQLDFACLDICAQDPLPRGFDALVDRGCLHGLLKDLYPVYATRVAGAARSGARFLLLYALHHAEFASSQNENILRENAIDRLRATFSPYFDIVDIQSTTIQKKSHPVPALALRLIRNEAYHDRDL